MDEVRRFSAQTEGELLHMLTTDLSRDPAPLDYRALLDLNNTEILLEISIDLGGGFEGGYAFTRLSSAVQTNDFRFAIHHENFIDDIGKFFGMQNVKLGYEDFDPKVVVKTSDEAAVRELFRDPETRRFFAPLHNYSFGITDREEGRALELFVEDGYTEPANLQPPFMAYYSVLQKLKQSDQASAEMWKADCRI